MLQRIKSLKIVQSFLILKGNTRISILFEPLYGVSFTLYNFYLSLYLKEMGVTDQQLGGIIAAGFLSGAFFSLFGGIVTDYLGRKKTTLYFDFIAWPFAILLYFISRSFLMFIIATVVNNIVKIVAVSWNLMVIEDADSDQRKSAFNLLNIINISMGIFTPLAGLFVARLGIIRSERIFMIFAIISMTVMVIFRNKYYTETKVGQQILSDHKGLRFKEILGKGLFRGAVGQILKNSRLRNIIVLQVLFNLTMPLGAVNSMYFAPYMTDHIGIDKAAASVLGGVYAGVMLFVFLVINPVVSKKHVSSSILIGLILQGASLAALTLIKGGVMFYAILAVGVYAFGYGIFIPFLNSLFADVTEGKERAGTYSFVSAVISILSAVIGAVSGFIYASNPHLIFYFTVFLLVLCIGAMLVFIANEKRHHSSESGSI